MSNPTQRLYQKVLQKYGWSATFGQTEEGYWYVDVTVGYNDKRRFVASNERPNITRKDGIKAVSALALVGLDEEIRRQEAKPLVDLRQLFPQPILIKESNEESWSYFWKNKPKAVGIDTEGNQIAPPALLQIATDEYVIMEAPKDHISTNVHLLLNDQSIVKIFCDNFSHSDKISLGIYFPRSHVYISGHIVDLESIAAQKFGPLPVARGLAKISTLATPELDVRIKKSKSSIRRFVLIEQGKAPRLNSIWNLSQKELQYAALDAWATLQAYHRLVETTIQEEQQSYNSNAC